MKLALRHQLPADAALRTRVAAGVIEARLVTQFAHAGIVIGDTLHHATAQHGLVAEAGVDLSGWLLVDLGEMRDARALALWARVAGGRYDWASLLAYAGIPARDGSAYYCYELAYLLITAHNPAQRVTAETLLLLALQMGGRLLSALPAVKAIPMEIHHDPSDVAV